MIRKNSLASFLPAALLAGAVSVGPAFAQEAFKSEGVGSVLRTFVSATTYQGVQQTATDSGGVLASYRYFFNDYTGVEVNYGFAAGTQKYLYFPGLYNSLSNSIRANSDEATAALVLRCPKRRVVPFGLLGTGALIFDPRSAPATKPSAGRLCMWGRHRYRPRAPLVPSCAISRVCLQQPGFQHIILGPDRVTHRAEPSIGFGIRL